jgi:RND family efflux transporter MFP subunit
MLDALARPLSGRTGRFVLAAAVLAVAGSLLLGGGADGKPEAAPIAARPALSVSLVQPRNADWPLMLAANGSVAAWQEALIGAEISGYRITDIRVDVGDRVKKGELLARIASETVASELAEAQAEVAELAASADEARTNAERARELREKGFYSAQQAAQYQTAGQTAAARLVAARARLAAVQVKMGKTSVLAPDEGTISARAAVVGSLAQTGQELFRLIRGGRLEWRAEVPSAVLGRLAPGVPARLTGPGGERVDGRVRSVAPSVDPNTRNGLVYVDLPEGTPVKAGMFARGEFELGRAPALVLPQSAVVLREGFAYAFRLGESDRVAQIKVQLGRRLGEQVEIVDGLKPEDRIVAAGAAFLADGDAVKVVDATPAEGAR